MVALTALWLPIVLSAVIVFIASSIIHMFLTYHHGDFKKLPNEANIQQAFRDGNVAPGSYMFPAPDNPKDMHTEEMKQKMQEGPNAFLYVIPSGGWNMGRSLGLWFVYCLGVSFMTAYVCHATLGAGTHYLGVFRVAGTVAFLSYSIAHLSDSIWMGVPWPNSLKNVFDGLVYGLLTAGTFGWLWPH